MKEKLSKFLKENGFLLFLFICVGVVAFSTIYMVTKDLDLQEEDLLTKEQIEELPKKLNEKDAQVDKAEQEESKEELAQIEASKKVEEETLKEKKEARLKQEKKEEQAAKERQKVKRVEEEKKAPPQVEKKQNEQAKKEETLKEQEVKETFSQEDSLKDEKLKEKEQPTSNGKFIMPIDGKVITEFTNDSLIYSKTLDEWRSHLGIDIAASIGTKVKAPLDGIVKEISQDPLWGKVVVLDHGNGVVTKFANLGDTNMIKKGLNVKKGDYISVVGKTADIEMLMEPHLHFEVIKNGKLVDPRSIH